ncbi:uncharacterized protein LOC143459662 [Clavelina lepadiformis]|uniref:uncharacterized protein LOC143459662 n=1 Tax=Clavelina lepadiformis TaxID=159417 RepID=UPI0040437D85
MTDVYGLNASHPARERRSRARGFCSCDGNYAKSLQGICKITSVFIALLTFIIIGASPYWRTLFVIDGVTWPFHIVMLFTICVFLATLCMYAIFLSGQHLNYAHIAWPTVELYFNIAMFFSTLFAAILEATNVWRWDMGRGLTASQLTGGVGSNGFNGLGNYGYQSGLTFSQSLDYGSYCTRYPRDCSDYFSLMLGHNSYYGNHIFATILLFLLLISYAVSTFFSHRTWKVFKRDMTNGKVSLKPSKWARLRFRMSEIKKPNLPALNIRERVDKLLGRNEVDESAGDDIDFQPVPTNESTDKDRHKDDQSVHASSVYSDGKKSRHSSHYPDRRSRSSSGSNRRGDRGSNRDDRSHRSHKSGMSSARSERRRSDKESESSSRRREKSPAPIVVDMKKVSKDDSSEGNLSPVASVMI